jgi:hypothetical protein
MEMLCVMHEAQPYGHLLINGKPPSSDQMAGLAGIAPDLFLSLLVELESAGVFSKNRNGTIYSRRMTKDEKKRKDGKQAREKQLGDNRQIRDVLDNREIIAAKRLRRGVSEDIDLFDKISGPQGVPAGSFANHPSTHMPEARIDLSGKDSNTTVLDLSPTQNRSNGLHVVVNGEADFEAWWKIYPRHVAKGAARTAYSRARKKAPAPILLAAAKRYASSQPDPKFTAHPSTWLNQERWLDEPEKSPSDDVYEGIL